MDRNGLIVAALGATVLVGSIGLAATSVAGAADGTAHPTNATAHPASATAVSSAEATPAAGEGSSGSDDAAVDGPRRPVRRPVLREAARTAADAIGVDVGELRQAWRDGRSIAEVAEGAGVDPAAVVEAIVADLGGRIDAAVADGRLDPERAATARQRLPEGAERLVGLHRGDLRRGQGG